jgi:hypothetical protein
MIGFARAIVPATGFVRWHAAKLNTMNREKSTFFMVTHILRCKITNFFAYMQEKSKENAFFFDLFAYIRKMLYLCSRKGFEQ